MLVRQVLQEKGAAIHAVPHNTTVFDIVKILAVKGIGTVLVTEQDGRLAGIVSERDIIRYLALHGADALELAAEEIMTRRIVACSPTTAVENALEQMRVHTIRHLPVVHDGVPVGVISSRDLVAAQKALLEQDGERWQRGDKANMTDYQFE